MQPRAAQGSTYTAFLQKHKMLWCICSIATQIEASTSPGCFGNRNGAKLEFPKIEYSGSPVSEKSSSRHYSGTLQWIGANPLCCRPNCSHLLLGLNTIWRSTRKLRADAPIVETTLAMFCPTTTGRAVAANNSTATQNKTLFTPTLRSA